MYVHVDLTDVVTDRLSLYWILKLSVMQLLRGTTGRDAMTASVLLKIEVAVGYVNMQVVRAASY